MRNISDKISLKIETYFVFNKIPPPKIVPFMRYVGNGTVRQATDDLTIRSMCIVCRIGRATDTLSAYNRPIFLLFYGNNGYANAP
jgi:hypothetical protein